MHRFRIVSASLVAGLALAACQPPKVTTPRNDTPADNTPADNTPADNTPGGNTPGGNTPGGNAPGGNAPGGDTPGGDTPLVDENSPRPVDKSSNAALASLSLSAGTLTPEFTKDTTAYTVNVAYPSSTTTVTATAADAKAYLSLNGTTLNSATASEALPLLVGATQFAVVVTAEDGTTSSTYTVTVNRPIPSEDATLSALAFSAGRAISNFAPSTTTYAFDVPHSVTSITVTATTTQKTASLQINGKAARSGQASPPIELVEGRNPIEVLVTAEDGTPRRYAVSVRRLSSVELESLTISRGKLGPIFDPGELKYKATVPFSESIDVTATLADKTSSLKIGGENAISGQPKIVLLTSKNNLIEVAVAKIDGSKTNTYTLEVIREHTGRFNLILKTGNTLIEVGQNADGYFARVDRSIDEVNVTVEPLDDWAYVEGVYNEDGERFPGAESDYTIPLNQDGTTTVARIKMLVPSLSGTEVEQLSVLNIHRS